MYKKNPFLNPIIIIALTIVLIVTFYVCKILIQPAGAIYLTRQQSSSFEIVSVVAEDMSVPFFGTAFHINYNTSELKYDHFSLGDYFTPQDDPLVLVSESLTNEKIMAGISLKRGNVIKKPNGTLIKLYFKPIKNIQFPQTEISPSEFSFSNTVFSTFDMQTKQRKNIANITFYP
ncbi:hypothetical protein JW911_00010 [Candidatus Peregrinibacteria bacterium]|nr:hypothetical protein [Candidatus Peregrinibacteria bacterium]